MNRLERLYAVSEHLRRAAPQPVSAAEQLFASLSPTSQIAVENIRSRIRVQRQEPVAKRASRTIEEALRRSVVVNIDYTDAEGHNTTRGVEAVGFYNGSDGWYLIGWCHLREAGRLFRLDRIAAARLTSAPSEQRDVSNTLGWVPHDVAIP